MTATAENKRVHVIQREPARPLSGPRVLAICVTKGQATPVMVDERVATRQGNAATVPDKPAIDLGCSFHIPIMDRLRPWTRMPTSVVTQLHLRLP